MDALESLLSRPEPPPDSVSPWTLARFQARDLPAEQARAVGEAVRGDPGLAEALRDMERQEAAFRREMPWSAVRDEVISRALASGDGGDRAVPARMPFLARFRRALSALGPSGAGRRLAGAVALGAAAIALAVLVPWPGAEQEPGRAGSRYKADRAMEAFLLRDGRPERVEAGSTLGQGDRIQFRVSSPHSFLALLGVDGTAVVSRYIPVGGETSAPFVPGNSRPLPDSLELDGAPGPEVFVAFLSDEALLVEDLESALHDVATDGAGPRGLLDQDWQALGLAPQVSVFFVEKE